MFLLLLRWPNSKNPPPPMDLGVAPSNHYRIFLSPILPGVMVDTFSPGKLSSPAHDVKPPLPKEAPSAVRPR